MGDAKVASLTDQNIRAPRRGDAVGVRGGFSLLAHEHVPREVCRPLVEGRELRGGGRVVGRGRGGRLRRVPGSVLEGPRGARDAEHVPSHGTFGHSCAPSLRLLGKPRGRLCGGGLVLGGVWEFARDHSGWRGYTTTGGGVMIAKGGDADYYYLGE